MASIVAFGPCYYFSMYLSKEMMIRPSELGWALLLPLIRMVCGFTLFVAAIHLLAGEDPTELVGQFLIDSTEALLPLAGRLAVLWLFYLPVYSLLGTFRDLWIVARFPTRLPKISRRRCFSPCLWTVSYRQGSHCIRSLTLQRPWPADRLSLGWSRGFSHQME